MVVLGHTLLALALVPVILGYQPMLPITCYTTVLNMARKLTLHAAELKTDPETSRCMANIPDLYIDVHAMRDVLDADLQYVALVEGLRERHCAYTREVRRLGVTMRQLYIIMSQKCRGELVFTSDDCAALE